MTALDDPVRRRIADRLKKSGVDIAPYIARMDGDSWDSNPPGFNFIGKKTWGLIDELRRSRQFGRCVASWDLKAGKASFREMSQPGSLHIHVGDDGQQSICHIDSQSLVKGINTDGTIEYIDDLWKFAMHGCIDLMHMAKP